MELANLKLFLIAGMLGGLVGLERQFAQVDEKGPLLGVRTFVFISLLGAISAMVSQEYISWFLAASFLGLVALAITRYYLEVKQCGDIGITTEITELLVFLIGAITYWEHITLAIALVVVVTMMLSIKDEVQKWTERIEAEDIRAAVKFAIITFVIYPLLEDKTVDPWGLFNPREIWLMVVLISGVSFTGYVILKFGRIRGALELTGLFGGLVSSTAVALSFSRKSKQTPDLSRHLALGIVLAELIMFPRLLLLVRVVGPKLFSSLIIPLGTMFVVGLILVLRYWMSDRSKEKVEDDVSFRNPFEISTALTFGAIYAAIRALATLALGLFGQKGLYITALLSGVADTDAITLSVAKMVEEAGEIIVEPRTGAIAVTLAAVMNTVFKGSLALTLAAPQTRRPVVIVFIIIIVAGLACLPFI